MNKELVNVSECALCGEPSFEPEMSAGDWQLVRCANCSLVFTNPRYSDQALESLYSEEYYDVAKPYADQQFEPADDDQLQLAKRIKRLIGTATPAALDVGCGGGRMVEAFAAAGFHAAGIEPGEGVVNRAQAMGRNVTKQALEEVPGGTFNCVTALHVLEHVANPRQFIEQIHRVVKENGVVVIEVPNYASKARQDLGADWQALHPASHLFQFTPDTLRLLLLNAGFSVVQVQRLGGSGVLRPDVNTGSKVKQVPDNKRSGLLATLWQRRSTLKKIPFLKKFWRWYSWEYLGHGEYLRMVAVRR